MKINLGPRLKKISDSIVNIDTLADIGTDHGYLPVNLVLKKRIKKAIACDIRPMPLSKAQSIISENKLEAFIETRLGSGLSVLEPGEANTIVIAGMGGKLISELLDKNEDIAKLADKLILQPMNNQSFLRRFLEKNNYLISEELMVREDRRIYEIMIVQTGSMKIENWLEYELGYRYFENRNPLLRDLINRKLELERRIIKETLKKKTPIAKEQFTKSSYYIKALEEVIRCLKN